MTGLVYPVGVIPEMSMVHKHKHRIEEAFLVFLKKEDFVRGNDLKISNILGIDFSMTGVADIARALCLA
jgi:hypothetical protein